MRPDSSIQWLAYPALLFAGAFAVGVVADSTLAYIAPSAWMAGAALCILLFAGFQWWDHSRLVTLAPIGRLAAVLLLGISTGGLRHALYQDVSPRALSIVAGESDEEVGLRGVVADAPDRTGDATRFTIRAHRISGAQGTASVEGKARVTLRPSPWADDAEPFPRVVQGDVVRLEGALRRPMGLRNPGGFNYRAYLDRRGVCCTVYVSTADQVEVLGEERTIIGTFLVGARDHIRQQIRRFIPSAGGRAVLRALLLGDRSRITDEQRSRFAKTGLMHLLAVSGLHVFLVGMVLYILLRPFLMRFRFRWRTVEIVRAALTVLALSFYMLLTGARPSVVRATIMATLLIGGVLFQRSAHSLNTLGVAAIVLLAVRPPALFDVGFQLSMAAVAGIVTLNPRFLEVVPERYKASEAGHWLVSSVTVSIAAILGTAPVLLYHFGWVSAAGVVLNVVGIPFTGLALSAAIVMTIAGSLWTVAGMAFGSAADLFVQCLLATSRYGADWFSWFGLRMPTPEPWVLGTLVASLIALAQWPRPRTRWRWVIATLLLASVSVWGNALGRGAAPTVDVIFFDVGQGDAALIVTPEKHRILVDAGPRSPTGAEIAHAALPYFERRGIEHLDAAVISHPDEDHLGGLPTLLREMSVDRVVHNGQPADTELYAETERLLQEEEVSEQIVERGDTLAFGDLVRAQVLSPPSEPHRSGIGSRNGASVVLHLAYGAVDLLFTGDVEREAEKNLVQAYRYQLSSRVVKVPHHGSSTSSTPEFVQASAPPSRGGRAVVSVGRGDQYGMPDEGVMRRWENNGMTVRSTAQSGAVWLRCDGEECWEVSWK